MNEQDYAKLPPDQFFAQMRKHMQEQEAQEAPKGRALTDIEERKMTDGFSLEEMTKTPGWKILTEILSMMPMSHVDPRGMTEQEWKFAELNAFWQGEVAKTLLDSIGLMIQEAHELHMQKVGESKGPQKFRI